MKTINDTVGCQPFPKNTITTEKTQGGFQYVGNYVTLTPLKVVVGNDRIPAGTTVYVSSRDYTSAYGKTVYKLEQDGLVSDVIFVPSSHIVMVDK